MATLLEQLSAESKIVADTGVSGEIAEFAARDVTTNPSLITERIRVLMRGASNDVADDHAQKLRALVVRGSRELGLVSSYDEKVKGLRALSLQVTVATGVSMLEQIPGRVSTEVAACFSFDEAKTIQAAEELINAYAEAGIDAGRILVKIPATWEGIRAAEKLEKRKIRTNLTLLFSLEQALLCAEAGVTLISPFVGRVTDWYKGREGRALSYAIADDPGVAFVRLVYRSLKARGAKTELMAASFRSIEQILGLAGCDLLTIAPKFLRELHARSGEVRRGIDETVKESVAQKILNENLPALSGACPLAEADFRWRLNENPMANENLRKGISLFHEASQTLDKLLLGA